MWPERWTETTIGELFTEVKEKVTPADDELSQYIGLEHLRSSGGIQEVGNSHGLKSAKNVFQRGDVLYGKLRPYLDKHAIADIDGVCSTDIIVYRANELNHAKWLNYFFSTQHFIEYANANSKGINLPRVSPKDISSKQFPLPPQQELDRIVARLDALFERVARLRARLDRAPELLRRYRQSVLARAVSGELTRDWREEHEVKRYEFIPPLVIDEVPKQRIPNHWHWSKLIDVAMLESGHTPRKSVPEYWDNGDVPWISLQDIREADGKEIFDTKYQPTLLGIENSSARVLPKGTVCFSRDISVGFVTIMGRDMATTQHFANWICGEKLFNRYLMYAFIAARDTLVNSGQGTTVKTIYMPALKQMTILLPPLEEQQEIVRRVTALLAVADRLEERFERLREQLERLPQAILAKAFRGELVAQDPADEPAEALLERVRREKKAQMRMEM